MLSKYVCTIKKGTQTVFHQYFHNKMLDSEMEDTVICHIHVGPCFTISEFILQGHHVYLFSFKIPGKRPRMVTIIYVHGDHLFFFFFIFYTHDCLGYVSF